jgi:hypothetical protein
LRNEVLLIALASACGDPPPEPRPLPEGIGAPCDAAEDCDAELICVVGYEGSESYLNTCQMPCGVNGCNEEGFAGCFSCFEATPSAICREVTCSG